jgi:ribonuclease P protein component
MRSSARLRNATDFERVTGTGRRSRHDGLVVYAAPSEDPKVGFAIPRSAGTAVERNRARRRLRELARKHMGTGHDVAVRAESSAVAADFQELERHLTGALRELGADGRS